MHKKHLQAVASLSALFLAGTLAGCGGSNSSNNNGSGVTPPAAALLALQSDGLTLRGFDSRSANVAQGTKTITGLQSGETFVAIDYRAAPLNGASQGLYGVTNQNRLYVIDTNAGTATQVGSTAFSYEGVALTLTDPGLDFNPTVDRIRLVQGTFNGRLNETVATGNPAVDSDANTAGVQPDGTLAYATGDANFGQTPNIVAAAYTNNVTGTTSTINYAIDKTKGVLVTQGRPDSDGAGPDAAVSPNTGQLFTVGSLGIDLSGAKVSFEIANGTTNDAFVLVTKDSGSRLYSLNLSTGSASRIKNGATSRFIGLTSAPLAQP